MRRDDPSFARGGGGGFSFEAPTSVGLSAPGTEAFKQDFAKWEELRRQATQVLDSVEASLSKKLQAKQAHDRLAAGADDKAPAGYQKQVDELFQGDRREEKTLEPDATDAFCLSAALVAGGPARRGDRGRGVCRVSAPARRR